MRPPRIELSAAPEATPAIQAIGVEETLPTLDIRIIALLRLDTDFYASTRAELEHLYGKLVRGGVLIVDDYGIVQGSRRATDEFLAGLPAPPLLNRIDGGVWAGVKP